MIFPKMQTGDVFCVRSTGILGEGINAVQKFFSSDNESLYTHAGIILNKNGRTFEALNKIKNSHIDRYIGKRILIARPTGIDLGIKAIALNRLINDHNGDIYPFWRLGLHLIPFAAKFISAHGRFLVCSELVAKYLYMIGARHEQYTGTNPDELADELSNYKNYEIIFEGIYGK